MTAIVAVGSSTVPVIVGRVLLVRSVFTVTTGGVMSSD